MPSDTTEVTVLACRFTPVELVLKSSPFVLDLQFMGLNVLRDAGKVKSSAAKTTTAARLRLEKCRRSAGLDRRERDLIDIVVG